MGLHITGKEVRNKGHTYYEMKCDECCAIKLVRKDHVTDNMECNALRHTHPEIAILLNDTENEFDYAAKSGKIAEWKCPKCGFIFKRRVKDITNRGFNCCQCSDNISYPNRYMNALLSQLNVSFDREKIFDWSQNKRYDFYIESENIIIEMNGRQHYEECGYYENFNSVHDNDLLKERLAKENNIKEYICIDARESGFGFITNSVLSSPLSLKFNFSDIDMDNLEKSIQDSMFDDVINIWNGKHTVSDISETFKVSKDKVLEILKKATKLGLCEYDARKQSRKWLSISHKLNMKKVICVNSGKVYESINNAAISNGISPKALSNCLTGRSNSCGKDKITNQKLLWKFMED